MDKTLEQIRSYAEQGRYKRVPISKELYADAFTPISVMRTLRAASKHCYLLESAEDRQQWGRYSFLGYAPTMEITCTDGRVIISEGHEDEDKTRREVLTDHPGKVLREILEAYKSPVVPGLPPFTGGLVGYFSYDYIKYAEPTLKPVLEEKNETSGKTAAKTAVRDFRDADLMLFDRVIVFDNYRQKLILITGVKLEGDLEENYTNAKQELEEMERLIRSGAQADFRPLVLEEEFHPGVDKEDYCKMVEKAKEYIYEGDIFQVVLSNPLTAKAKGSLFDTYRVLRTSNPSPYMFYFSSDDIEVAGASPETLAKLENGQVCTFPLAGTRKRGVTEEEDQELEKELLADEKELAEHNMLVDLGRNDVGKIRKDKDALDVVDAILPAGTLSGAPKIRACEIIAELEQEKRGIYGGAVGYLDFAGNVDTCISIRLAYKKNGYIRVQSGAGIVADSIPENEFQECLNKAGAVLQAVETAKGGLE